MHAMIMTGPGEPDVLRPARVPIAWPAGPGGVLVRLKAAGLNPADVCFRRFGPYFGDGKNYILGHDGASVSEEIGDGVTSFKSGDAVCFCHGGVGATPGTYVEYAVVPEGLLVAKPDNVGFAGAAALPQQADMVPQGVAWLAAGRVKVHVEMTCPLAEMAAAHRRLECGAARQVFPAPMPGDRTAKLPAASAPRPPVTPSGGG